METLLVIAADGLVYASWIFLVSAGLSLIFGVLRILNIAHGSLYALGAYMGAWLVTQFFQPEDPTYWSYLLLFGGALIIGVGVGPLIERGVLRWTYGRGGGAFHDEVLKLLVTFALLLILTDAIKLVWGVSPYYAYQPYSLLGSFSMAGIPYTYYSFLLTGIAVVAGVSLWLLLNRTRFGKLITTVIQDREMSQALGINVSRVFTVAFTIGTVVAALGGAFTAPMISVVPGIGVNVIVLAFAVVVIGGLGSLEGAALGALSVGLVRAAMVHLAPQFELFAIYLVMALVLLVRPYGLFGEAEVKRI